MNTFKDGKYILDFSAKWCGPCKRIEPDFNKLKETHTEITFVKYDVDVDVDVAREFNVRAMPTFVAINDGEEVERFEGASVHRLNEMVKMLLKLTADRE
jgi:thioredoxin